MNLYQNLLERLQTSQSDEERAWITLQFNLDTLPATVRKAVTVVAVLHWFDRNILNFMLETELSDTEFHTLIALPYIEEFPDLGWNVHEKNRELLRDKLWQADRAHYQKLSRRAAACYRKHTTDPVWQVEAVYHSLLAEERKAVDTFINLSTRWHNHFQLTELEALVNTVLSAAKAGRLTGISIAWTMFFQSRLHYFYSRFREAKVVLIEALATIPDDSQLKANCLHALGTVHNVLSEIPQARTRYQEALPICRAIGDRTGEANCIQALGDVHESLSEFHLARARYLEALPIYRAIKQPQGIANCIQSLGDVHEKLSEWPQARTCYQEALPSFRAIGDRMGEANCIQALGNVHGNLSEFPQAWRRYIEALPIYQSIGNRLGEANCIQALGSVHNKLSEWPQARARYQEALLIYRDIGDRLGEANCIFSLADVSGEEGEIDQALAHFHDAAQRYGELGMTAQKSSCYNSIGVVFLNNRKYPEALASFDQAIKLFPDVSYYTNRAEPHMHLDDYSSAQLDLEAATAQNPDFNYLHFNRGRLALWQKQPQAALEHFNHALRLSPEYGEFHLWLALALSLSGAAWNEALQSGLARTHLTRQIREAAEAADKLTLIYNESSLLELRSSLHTALVMRSSINDN